MNGLYDDKKCNVNFKTNFAYINNGNDNECINIHDYIDRYHNDKAANPSIKCLKGHDLVCVNGKINAPHFRHKNSDDVGGDPMTAWHCDWQGCFPKTEVPFPKINNKQIKNRKADALIEEFNIVVEFQHSVITQTEVNNRKNDYLLNNKNILWIVDGNDTIQVTSLNHSKRTFLEFVSDVWKYKAFVGYEFIFVDICNLIYKIYPNNVKNDMIDVSPPIHKDDFINLIMTNDPSLFEIDIPDQSNLYIKQQGAGNGKTFGLIQMLESDEFAHYKHFIIVSKQHSAKYVIYAEFKNQIDNGLLNHLQIINENDYNKKYSITYKNKKNDSICQIVVATIDSFMYALGDTKNKECDKFEGVVNSIIDGYIESNNINSIYYNGKNIRLNKEICLICDETQDLAVHYAKAIIHIMRNKYIDAYVVGDKLQSIMNENNAFTYLMNYDFPYVNKISFEYTNIVRRFHHPTLVKFVNSMIPFDKYNLPSIVPYKTISSQIPENSEQDPNIFVFSDDDYVNTYEYYINNQVETIMNYYNDEVIKHNYKPNDFLFVTPFTQKNILANSLENEINSYWTNKYNPDTYTRYAIFHKSDEGSSINLAESENATRIVSIHTSKGDGRNVVFVIGITEYNLMRFSNEANNLLYDSLIHVALTRMIKKLYIQLYNNDDDFCKRIKKAMFENNINKIINPNLSISNTVRFNHICNHIRNNDDFIPFRQRIIEPSNVLSKKVNESIPDDKLNPDKDMIETPSEKQIVDMGHHNIRFMSMIIHLYIKIIKNLKKNKTNGVKVKDPCFSIFKKLINIPVYITNKNNEYNDILEKNSKYEFDTNTTKQIVLYKINNKDNIRFLNIIEENIQIIKTKLDDLLSKNANIVFCPFESIILYYMIQIFSLGEYSDITMSQLYNIVDIYSNSFDSSMKGHTTCLCKSKFKKQCVINNTIQKTKDYLFNHYEQILNIGVIYDKFLGANPNIKWLINNHFTFNGNNKDISLKHMFPLIGYTDKDIFIVYPKPQLNDLNTNQILLNCILETFIVLNGCNSDEDTNKNIRFKEKNVHTVLFALNSPDYIDCDWKNEGQCLVQTNKDMIVSKIKDKIIKKYNVESSYVYMFYKYHKDKHSITETSPDKIIKRIIQEFKSLDSTLRKTPEFVYRFLYKIQNKIDDTRNKKEKQAILNSYDDQDLFLSSLNDKIIDSIDDFFDDHCDPENESDKSNDSNDESEDTPESDSE